MNQPSSELPTCDCGWPLPSTPTAFPHGRDPALGAEVPRAYVALNCPCCGATHSFVNAADPDAAAEHLRQQLTGQRPRNEA